MMEQFRITGWADGLAVVGGEEAHHALRVHRLAVGDALLGTEGRGVSWQLRVRSIDMRRKGSEAAVRAEMVAELPGHNEPPAPLGLAFGLLKNRDRMEWLLEKATELGCTHFFPLLTDRSERQAWNAERVERLLWAAVKQCQRSQLPLVAPPQSLGDFLASPLLDWHWLWAQIGADAAAWDVLAARTSGPTCVLVGPEGDWSDPEVGLLHGLRTTPLSLGRIRLRTETAGLHALSLAKGWLDRRAGGAGP